MADGRGAAFSGPGVPEDAGADEQPGSGEAWSTRRGLVAMAGSTSVLVAATLLGCVLGFLEKVPCRAGAWNVPFAQFQRGCYTDIYPEYFAEGLSSGKVPYTGHPVEYPVLMGGAMQAVAWVVRNIANPFTRGREFFDVTAAVLVVFAISGVLATGYLAGRNRRWQALLVALAPGLVLSAFINWDLIALSLAALGLAAWAARREVLAGVLLGLAVATKFYPVLFLGPLLLLCLRAGRMRAFLSMFASGVVAWLAVNVPVMLAAPSGWATFYQFSSKRGADWGSIWYYLEHMNVPVFGTTQLSSVNLLSLGIFALACAVIAVLALAAPRRPRLPQLCFLILAAFLMTNKVWSPQYVLWLLPLAVLARPRFWPYALWQLAEIAYFFGIWGYLIFVSRGPTPIPGYNGISTGWYFAVLLGRFLTVALLCGYVVRDILRPDADVVRSDGEDDPAGGVLSGAPDRFVLRATWRPVPAAP